MLLEGKNAVVYGGAGSIGSAVASAFAREGARVFLTGRTAATLEQVAERIRAEGGRADVAVVDALDQAAVEAHASQVVKQAGSLDISMNVIQHGDVQGTPMLDMDVEDYLRPVVTGVRTTFYTATAAGRRMKETGGGVILIFGGSGPPTPGYSFGGLQVGFAAMESMRRQIANEMGAFGVRCVTLRTGGIVESLGDWEGVDEIREAIDGATMLGRAASLEDVGHAAAFAASDRARSITASTINISAGALLD
jgi:NAD(P)-dependent dehydrogenase (short-subunit alcohol dehydrogenase family)